MKLKDKIKSYSFWVSLASAVILILKVLGTRFGFTVDESMVSDIFTALCSILVLMGIIVVPANAQNSSDIEDKSNDDSGEMNNNSLLDNSFQNFINKEQNTSNSANDNNIENTIIQTNNFEQIEQNDFKYEIKLNSSQNSSNSLTTGNKMDLQEEIENIEDKPMSFELESETEQSNKESIDNQLETENVIFENQTNNEITKIESNELLIEEKIPEICSENPITLTQNTIASSIDELKSTFETERNKFEGDLRDYLSVLQEEIQIVSQKIE